MTFFSFQTQVYIYNINTFRLIQLGSSGNFRNKYFLIANWGNHKNFDMAGNKIGSITVSP